MRTLDFEQMLMGSIANATTQSWWHLLQQKHAIKLIKRKTNTTYAEISYKQALTFEVPTRQGLVLMTIGHRQGFLDFYYFGIVLDQSSSENLKLLYDEYRLFTALRGG
jgi:hypothetical protein